MMEYVWLEKGLADYREWMKSDKNKVRKINSLIEDILRNGKDKGIGKPEPLKGELSGLYSRHIDKKNRLTYYIANYDGEDVLVITSCKGHYEKKQ